MNIPSRVPITGKRKLKLRAVELDIHKAENILGKIQEKIAKAESSFEKRKQDEDNLLKSIKTEAEQLTKECIAVAVGITDNQKEKIELDIKIDKQNADYGVLLIENDQLDKSIESKKYQEKDLQEKIRDTIMEFNTEIDKLTETKRLLRQENYSLTEKIANNKKKKKLQEKEIKTERVEFDKQIKAMSKKEQILIIHERRLKSIYKDKLNMKIRV